ncbi:hypothetical protein PHMEG_00033774 [Phytophthora megakarya]|uniref:Uncharacterized protein n=1 Tax=Phytophthora megakarya TaxID=4795 RepID=A0A225UT34_9STRA|nr:hypothetical protein PHMEG_00033774 [Phytophthora megakarya]
MNGFERALAAAAASGSIAAVTYLYNKHLVSLEGIYRAFEVAGSLAVSAFLYKMEEIPASSITAAFENVTGVRTTTIPMQRKD